jgi:cytochrome b6-f complex iron-sulfur subunit
MSALVVIAIVLVVLFALATVLATVRRREGSKAVGQLSRETIKRDQRRRRPEMAEVAAAPAGREVERAAAAARTSTEVVTATSTAPTVWVPPDPETYGVTRRQFLNRSIVQVMGLAITTFAAAAFTAFLWPTGSSGFGGLIRIGKISDIKADIQKNSGFLYKPEGRMWVTEFPAAALPKARIAYKGLACLPGMEAGIVALYQKCVHLGCRVPACLTSQWFECPCHGSQYNRVGEKKGGPAPRGLDRFPVEVASDGSVTVDTASSKIILGPPIGTNTTGQEAEGPHCVGG